MTASHSVEQRFSVSLPALQQAAADALADIGASGHRWSTDGRAVAATVGTSLWSWGEQVTVSMRDDGTVRVHSECSFPLQLIDYGKNGRNCRTFLERLHGRLANLSQATSVPAGWYPDPQSPGSVRWWDGARWTEHVAQADGSVIAG